MSSIFGTAHLPGNKQKPLGLQAARSSTNESARPIPWLIGRRRLGLTFISNVFDLRTESVSSGGKAGIKTGDNYFASFAALACLGPVDIFHDIFLNQNAVYDDPAKLTIVSLFNIGTLATAQTKSAHNLVDGDIVVVYMANEPQFNGQFPVTVLSATQFCYTIPGQTLNREIKGKAYARKKLPPISRSGADSTDITIPDYGIFTLHWGTETQQADDYLNLVYGSPFPGYRGITYFVFKQLFLGFNQSSVQNVEAVLERTPAPAWLLDPAHANINGDANPAVAIAELLQHPRAGLRIPDDEINFDSLAIAAEQFYDDACGISRILTDLNEVQSLLAELCETCGAQPIRDSAGRFALNLLRYSAGTPPAITDNNLTDPPEIEPADWSTVSNETRLTFDNRDNVFNSDAVEYKDMAAYCINDSANPLNLQRPWISQRSIAAAIVQATGRAAALPEINGKANLLFDATMFADLAPGSLFSLSYSCGRIPSLAGSPRAVCPILAGPNSKLNSQPIAVTSSAPPPPPNPAAHPIRPAFLPAKPPRWMPE